MDSQNTPSTDENSPKPDSHQPGEAYQPGSTESLATPQASANAQSVAGSPAPSQQSQTQPPKPKLAKWKVALIAVAGVLLLGGAGAFAYFGYYLPNQPENILARAMQNFLLAETMSFNGSATLESDEISPSVEVSGAIDTSGGALGSFWLDGQVNLSGAVIESKIRGQDNKLYVNLKGLVDSSSLLSGLLSGDPLEESGSALFFTQIFASFEDEWFEIGASDLSSDVPTESISDADKEKILDILYEHNILSVARELGQTDINGRTANGFEVVLNPDGIKAAVEEIINTEFESIDFSQDTKTEVINSLSEVEGEVDGGYQLEVWVYDNDTTIARVNMALTDNEGKLDLEVSFDNYNQPINVELPESSRPISELLGSLFSF